jgi:hypothetical protein
LNSATFSVVEGATIEADVGVYIVKVKLENSGGGSATYSFTITVFEDAIDFDLEEEEDLTQYSPVPTIV